MRINRPNPESRLQVTVIDRDTNISKSRTYYDTTIDDIFRILESGAEDAETPPAPKNTDPQ